MFAVCNIHGRSSPNFRHDVANVANDVQGQYDSGVRQTQRKTRKLAVQQTSSKEIGVTNNDERRGCSPMTVFPEYATPADIAH